MLFLFALLAIANCQLCDDNDRRALASSNVMCNFPSYMASCGVYFGFPASFDSCFSGKTAVSTRCARCFLEDIKCTLDRCPGANCFLAPTGQACIDCSKENCSPSLVTCTGVDADNLPPAQAPACCPNC